MAKNKELERALWKMMHRFAWNYPENPTEDDKTMALDLYENLVPQFLFCPACRLHYRRYVEEHPVDVSSKTALFRWAFDAHDDANRKLNNPRPSFDQVQKAYSDGTPEVLDEITYANKSGISSAAAASEPLNFSNLKSKLTTQVNLVAKDISRSLLFKERVLLAAFLMAIILLALRSLLAKLATFFFCV